MSAQPATWIVGSKKWTRSPTADGGIPSHPSFTRTLAIVVVGAIAGAVIAGSVGAAMVGDLPLDLGSQDVDPLMPLMLGIYQTFALSVMAMAGALAGALGGIGLANISDARGGCRCPRCGTRRGSMASTCEACDL